MANITYPNNYVLGIPDAHAFPKVQYAKIKEIIDRLNAITSGTITVTDVELGDGSVSLPSLTFAADLNTGLYRVGADEIGITCGGSQIVDISSTGLSVHGTITSNTSFLAPLFDTATAVAMTIGTTATSLTITPATTITGALTTTGGILTDSITEKTAGSGITLGKNIIRKNTLTALNSTGTVTAAMIQKGGITSTSAAGVTATLDTAANIGTAIGATNGTSIEFIVDNTAGANTVTVAVSSGITAATPVITGGGTLTVSVANAIGIFRLVFSDASTAKLYRIG